MPQHRHGILTMLSQHTVTMLRHISVIVGGMTPGISPSFSLLKKRNSWPSLSPAVLEEEQFNLSWV
jgi:hypothetical protein